MQNLKERFKRFHQKYGYLNIQEQIENFAIFDGFSELELELTTDIYQNIEKNIINHIDQLQKSFQTDQNTKKILKKLANGDRKQYAIYKNGEISQTKGKQLYRELYDKNIIKKEFSREKKIEKIKHQPLKKELRGYLIEDKLKFTKNFDRFWYTFLCDRDKNEFMDLLQNGLEKYISLTFEELSNELIKEDCFGLNIVESGSYWDRKVEIDLLAKDSSGKYIAGECKWTNQKICKNILRKLQNKVQYIDFEVTKFALFSKNGFSKSFQKETKEAILFDLNDFKRLNE